MSRPDRRKSGRGSRRPGWDATGDRGREEQAAAGRDVPGSEGGAFTCIHCGATIPDMAFGTSQRNHCPACLWSRHVDVKPGDRRSLCRSAMEPIAIWVLDDGEWRLVHRCTECGALKTNRIAGDDSVEAVQALADRLRDGPGPEPPPGL